MKLIFTHKIASAPFHVFMPLRITATCFCISSMGIKELTAHVIEIQTEGAAQAKPAPPQVQNCWQAADC